MVNGQGHRINIRKRASLISESNDNQHSGVFDRVDIRAQNVVNNSMPLKYNPTDLRRMSMGEESSLRDHYIGSARKNSIKANPFLPPLSPEKRKRNIS